MNEQPAEPPPSSPPLRVAIWVCADGWIEFELSTSTQSTRRWFSSVYDPFPHLLCWLEALAAGAPSAVLAVDEEHVCCWFEARQISELADPTPAAPMWFEVRDDTLSGGKQSVLALQMGRAALVRAIYECVREFVGSNRYVPFEWEDPPADAEDAFGGHGGTRLREWRSDRIERWLLTPSTAHRDNRA